MASIGKQDATATTDLENRTVDIMTGDGSDTTLVLSSTPISINNVLIFISGILQRPTTDYTLSGTTITFSEAPPTGLKVVAITGGGEHIGIPLTRLDASKFSNSSVTNAKIASGISASKLTGALPSLDGSALTGVSHANVSGVDTVSANDPTITTNPSAVGHIWLNRVSGEMFVCTDKSVGANVWTNVGEGTTGVPAYMVATSTGSNVVVTTDGNYKVYTFNDSGTFTPTIGLDATLGNKVEYLVIAGGGSGGTQIAGGGGGGGGAGGYKTATNFVVTNTALTITVGAGGAATSGGGEGASGIDSVFSTITSTGGGRGQGNNDLGNSNGGSGGGGNNGGTAGTGTVGQGNNGGAGHTGGAYGQGAGGGAGAVGANGTASVGGAGGAGLSSDIKITGTNVFYAGGGGGSVDSFFGGVAGIGGSGGGGLAKKGGDGNAVSGTDNLGAGGGGAHGTSNAGNGGSGVVIVRYKFQ